MNTQDTVRMANQIAAFFKGYGHDAAVIEVADHINRFWEPRMRRAFFAHMAAGGAGLDPLIAEAAKLVRKPHDGPPPLREPKDHETGLPKEA